MLVNWVAFAVSLHLVRIFSLFKEIQNGNLSEALKAIESTENIINKDVNNKIKPIEENEFILYKVKLLLDLQDFKGALNVLLEKKE